VRYLTNLFLTQAVGEVHIAYTHFKNAVVQKPQVKKFLNLETNAGSKTDFIFEPPEDKILETMIPRYLEVLFQLMMLESFTSEHAARSLAMKMATDNAADLLRKLTLLRNKVRQANITQDMLEIIASSEALKG